MPGILEVMKSIQENLKLILQPLIDEDLVKELVFGKKSRGKLELPTLIIIFGDATCDSNTLGAAGNKTMYQMDLILMSMVKNLENPYQGDLDALNIIGRAHSILSGNRHLNMPNIVLNITGNVIKQDPHSWDDKVTLYRRGTIFQLTFVIN
jgi:hypothetical protein